ncbi:MAG TPA: prepilin-type N-terminal cleavage/methylation domain-containing protein [Verrucomicrobiae bacterium]|nr:prepilin-type N-terminal cleavage/methylation domain-containing protein [Verrucomicrobiae bacterium]
MSTTRSRQAGFTLIEIMVVVGIIGLIALISIPNIYQLAKKEGMRRAVMDMRDVLINARARAILSGSEVQLKFYPTENRFEITGGAPAPTGEADSPAPPSAEASTPTPSQITAGTLPDGISFGMLQVNLLNFRESEWTRVRFFQNGTSDELRLVLTSDKGEAYGMELEPTTALVRVVSDLQEIRTWE